VRIRLLTVGRDRSGLFEPAVEEYARRLSHYCRFELVELKESKATFDPGRAVEEEGKALLQRIGPTETVVALDAGGKALSSAAFAGQLGRFVSEGRDLAFCIGGTNGLSDAVKARARLVLSLSPMTFPHRLARVIAAEQLYRAFTLLRGEPYHR
jgi:23S rRNA (pseudouridine1915-N3)-methyltransferase